MTLKTSFLTWAICALIPAQAATDGQFIQAGYAAPAPVEVAPGQVVTLFLRGVSRLPNGAMRTGQAATIPLPHTLAGLSVRIHQLPETNPYPVPLFSVRQHNECEEASGEARCLLTAIRVQIPTELTPAVAKLTVTVDGEPSRTFLIRPVREDIHVLTTCDLTWDTNPASDCARLAFHADGTPVNEARPARRRETIVIYAHGLGPTVPRVPTGTPAPARADVVEAVTRQLTVRFLEFRNASPSLPRYFESIPLGVAGAIGFAGLTPGQIGLYQINVEVPQSLDVSVACGGETKSNAIAKVATSRGTLNVALCVEP